MTVTTYWFAIATTLAAVLASIAIWSPRSLPLKVSALLCATAFLPVGYFGLNDILSRPKPTQLEAMHKHVEQVEVLSSVMQENKAIYLWLQIPEVDEPRAYQLPWSEETAKELHKAKQEAEEAGTQVSMKKPFEKTVDNQEPIFYAAPQPPPPMKQVADEQPIVFKAAQKED